MWTLKRGTVGFAGLGMVTALVSFAFGGIVRHDRDPALYLDLGLEYPSVGRIDFSAGLGEYVASGTLIASDWVLTAGHVVDEATSLSFTIGGQGYSANKWVPHPLWEGDLLAGYDIGLVRLSSQVTDVEPARRYKGSKELGAEATIVGYGMTGTGLTGAATFDGQKRAGENVIDILYGYGGRRKDQRLLLCDFDNPADPADNAYGSPVPLDLEFLIAPGDSGGGVFLESGPGPLLAGVNSFVGAYDEEPDSDYGDVSGHIRVSSFNRWIDKTIGPGKGRGKGPPPDGPGGQVLWSGAYGESEVVPEPATLGLLGCGGLALLLGRPPRRGRRG